jgi:transcriptional regulator with XRE-family HTH domain
MRSVAIHAKFGVVLRRYREAAGLSQRGLASITGHQRTHIGMIERGLQNLSLCLADSFARTLGTTLSVMILEAEKIRGAVEVIPVERQRGSKRRREHAGWKPRRPGPRSWRSKRRR